MSYDLMVFRPSSAPKKRESFMDWYSKQTEWKEDHNYDDPKVSSEKMRNWFLDMIKTFPAMNGPYAIDDIDNPKVTDYSIGRDVIYVAFAWSEAENAYPKMLELAEKHKVGFFDVSANNGNIYIPDENGGFKKIDNTDKESSIQEIKGWAGKNSDSKTVADIVFDKVENQLNTQNEIKRKQSWWKRMFKK